MDPQILSAIVIILVAVTKFFNWNIGSEEITSIVQALATIIAAGVIWYQRTTLQKAPAGMGDVSAAGMKR